MLRTIDLLQGYTIATIMCKVIRYYFKRGHQVKFRLSRCRGTYHKESRARAGVKTVACIADSYLNINPPFDCGPCQI
ncbi:hypothetical protein K469DRAFT_269062 [Zopfia rhizophila CBS 207.26]|uniref:Uncharacterized protein n=1 Tax=Zopfia rhizophila CBS 207.26 TaxID=1314779 RepID=A0A6A6DNY0_9PEZI|nr:hypothetical protein K469DRAFT_269062 [Zopfia rhizophila CBS 207.26]